jgi:hypothetical protein
VSVGTSDGQAAPAAVGAANPLQPQQNTGGRRPPGAF